MYIDPQDYDNWKDYAEAMMSAQLVDAENLTTDELIALIKGGQQDSILYIALAKKKDIAKSAPVLLAELRSFGNNEEGNDAMRSYVIEALYNLCGFKIANRNGEYEELFLSFAGKIQSETFNQSMNELEERINKILNKIAVKK